MIYFFFLGLVIVDILITYVGFSFFLPCIIATVFKIKGGNRSNKALVEAHSSKTERDSFMSGTQNSLFGCVFSYKENWNGFTSNGIILTLWPVSKIRRAKPGRGEWQP